MNTLSLADGTASRLRMNAPGAITIHGSASGGSRSRVSLVQNFAVTVNLTARGSFGWVWMSSKPSAGSPRRREV